LAVPLNSRLVSHNTMHRVRIRHECGSALYQKRIDGRKTRSKSFTYARARAHTSTLPRGISLAYKTLFAQEAVNSELFGGKFQRTTSSCKIKQRGMSLSGAGPSRISEIALRLRGRAVKRIPGPSESHRIGGIGPALIPCPILSAMQNSVVIPRPANVKAEHNGLRFYLWPDNVTRTITTASVDTAGNNARKHFTFIRRKSRSTRTNSCDLEIAHRRSRCHEECGNNIGYYCEMVTARLNTFPSRF